MRALLLLFFAQLFVPSITQAESLNSCDEAGLRAAVNAGGNVTFACDGTITLTKTLIVSNDTVLDATGHTVWISESNAVRLFKVEANANLTMINLTLANGRVKGTNGSIAGEAVGGAAIYNDHGTVLL